MREQAQKEPRASYLMRVAAEFILKSAPYADIEYDGTTCDGYCLAGELLTESDDLQYYKNSGDNPCKPSL